MCLQGILYKSVVSRELVRGIDQVETIQQGLYPGSVISAEQANPGSRLTPEHGSKSDGTIYPRINNHAPDLADLVVFNNTRILNWFGIVPEPESRLGFA